MKKFRPKPKKKVFKLLIPVKEFLRDQPGAVKQELNGLIWKLEEDGYLNMPHAEKIEGENMFAIRVIQSGNLCLWVKGCDLRHSWICQENRTDT